MNARKHREIKQAKETDRLEPKGTQSGSGRLCWLDANLALPAYRADLNHLVNVAEHGNAATSLNSQPSRPHRKAGQEAQPWEDRKS
jgi:hypothetical protein